MSEPADEDRLDYFFEVLGESEEWELMDRLENSSWADLKASDDPKIRRAVEEAEREARIGSVYEDETLSSRQKNAKAILAATEDHDARAPAVPAMLPLRVPSKYASSAGRRSTLVQLAIIVSVLTVLRVLGGLADLDGDDDLNAAFFAVILPLCYWVWFALRRLIRWRDSVVVYGDRVVLQRLMRSRTLRRNEVRQVLSYEGLSVASDEPTRRLLLFVAPDGGAIGRVDLGQYPKEADKTIAAAFAMGLERSRIGHDERAIGDAYPGSTVLLDSYFLGCLLQWAWIFGVFFFALFVHFLIVGY